MQIPSAFKLFLSIDPQRGVAFLPCLPITFKLLKPKESDFEPRTLGEHLKKKRLQMAMTQREAGKRLRVTVFTFLNWERGFRKPAIGQMPAIIDFLGYDPEPPTAAVTLPEQLAAKRRQLGLSQRAAAERLGVDPCTWSDWEAGGTIMATVHRRMIARFLGTLEEEIQSVMRKRWNDSHGRPTPKSK